MRIKRIIAGLLAVVTLASAVACGNEDGKKKNDGGDKNNSNALTEAPFEDVKPPVVEVTETLGDFDISDYVIESNVDPDFKQEFEAENGNFTGNAIKFSTSFLGEYSGEGFAGLSAAGDSTEFDVTVDNGGVYDITVVASGDLADKTGAVLVDGNKISSFTIGDTSKFSEYKLEKVELSEGSHKVSVAYDTTAVYVDKVTVSAAQPVDLSQFDVENKLVNPNASDRTKRLYSFLTDVYGKYIISGNYASEKQGIGGIISREFIEIEKNFGDYPAIMGLDLIELSPSRAEHGSVSNVIDHAIEWDKKGGIVTLAWHWNAPSGYLEVNGKAWWEGFYSEATNFNLAAALDGTDSKGYELLLSDIDAIAAELKKLEALDIPILWRPLHEAGGDPKWNNPWFWWGSSGSEAYKELWVLLYDRLTNYHKIDNLIWVWNGQNVDWYPGDEYVDIMGFDIYAEAHDTTSQKEIYDYTKSATSTNKIIALTENGVIPDPDLCMTEGVRWSWYAVWNGEFTLKDAQISSEYTPMEIWEKVFNHDRVLTLSELPDLKSYPLDTEAYLAAQN